MNSVYFLAVLNALWHPRCLCTIALIVLGAGMGCENLGPCQKTAELKNKEYVNLDMCRCSCVIGRVVKGLR